MTRMIRTFALMLVAALGASLPGWAQDPAGQGIKVHGDWTIEIRNPDGSLASRHEFKNALIPGMGTRLLAGLLGNYYEGTTWGIRLWGDPHPCDATIGQQNPCEIGQPALTVHVPMSSDVPSGTLELSGSVTVVQNTRLFNVNTIWNAGVRGTGLRSASQFSERAISIQVQQGQIVQVKVVFSFS